jgi:hypothetical protein
MAERLTFDGCKKMAPPLWISLCVEKNRHQATAMRLPTPKAPRAKTEAPEAISMRAQNLFRKALRRQQKKTTAKVAKKSKNRQ